MENKVHSIEIGVTEGELREIKDLKSQIDQVRSIRDSPLPHAKFYTLSRGLQNGVVPDVDLQYIPVDCDHISKGLYAIEEELEADLRRLLCRIDDRCLSQLQANVGRLVGRGDLYE